MKPETLASLHASAFSATRAWSAQEFRDLLANQGTILTGNEDCFALLRIVADEAEILTLATDPTKRRQGLASHALKAAETQAQALGAIVVFLEVAEDNAAARALYATSGYSQVGRRPAYYLPKNGAPVAALVLRKDLNPA